MILFNHTGKARQVQRETVDSGFRAVTNISVNFQKISGSIKFPENLQPSVRVQD